MKDDISGNENLNDLKKNMFHLGFRAHVCFFSGFRDNMHLLH